MQSSGLLYQILLASLGNCWAGLCVVFNSRIVTGGFILNCASLWQMLKWETYLLETILKATNLEQSCNSNWGTLISNLKVSSAGILGFLTCLRTVVSNWGVQSTYICFLLYSVREQLLVRDSYFPWILK